MSAILLPDFVFYGTFYWELKPDFRRWNRIFVPEINEDDPAEPYLLLQDSFALALHYRGVDMNAIAREAMWRTLELRESLESQIAPLGERLAGATAATSTLCARLIRRSGVPLDLVQPRTSFYTEPATDTEPSVGFECLTLQQLTQRNDKIGHVFASTVGGVFTDHTTAAQNPAGSFVPSWGATPAVGSTLYFGHADVMFTQLVLEDLVDETGIVDDVWEYRDDYVNQANPTAIEEVGGGLDFDLSGFLGTSNRRGTRVTLTYAPTGAELDLDVKFIAAAPSVVASLGSPTPTGLRFTIPNHTLTGSPTDLANWPGFNVSQADRVVVVRYLPTGVSATLAVKWNGTNNYVDTLPGDPFLGQVSPGSTTAANYWIDAGPNYVTTVGSESPYLGETAAQLDPLLYVVRAQWRELPDLEATDESGVVTREWTLPQTEDRDWTREEVNAVAAYWVRRRITAVKASPTSPTYRYARTEDGEHWVRFPVTQGATVDEIDAFSTNGYPDQSFPLREQAVLESTVTVTIVETPGGEGQTYTRALRDNFFNSLPEDRHFALDLLEDGQGFVSLGDGVNGRMPKAGAGNVSISYRVVDLGANGNVAAGAIKRTGVSFFDSCFNPRPSSGFAYPEGFDEDDIARLKREIPERVRSGDKITGPDDAIPYALKFKTAAGSKIAARAFVIEGESATKTTRLILVGTGGGYVTTEDLDELELAINGSKALKVVGVRVMNHRVEAENFSPLLYNLNVKLYGGDVVAVEAALAGILTPVAKDEDGDWLWEPGETVPFAEVMRAVMSTTPRPDDAKLEGTGQGTISSSGANVTGATNAHQLLNVGDEVFASTQRRIVASVALDGTTFTTDSAFSPALSSVASWTYRKGDVPLGDTQLPRAGVVTVDPVE